MTRIVVLCDGTWNSPDTLEPTHVVRMSRAFLSDPEQGQVVGYFPGIGTDRRYDGPVARFVNKWGGGAFGWGLDTKVKQAYEFIAKVYREGDEIYLLGFSRGAYTARSVAGMIRKCGIVADTSPEGINRAYALYRKAGPENAPDKEHIQRERAAMSPGFATSPQDLEARGARASLVQIAFVGVWDTVGAKGIPSAVLGPVAALWNRRYGFHDMALSRLVRRARHAVALDEMRVFYRPALWDNLDDQAGKPGLNGGDVSATRPYQQLWFVGNHGIVGGSGGARGLSAITMEWMLEGAPELALREGSRLPRAVVDPLADAPGLGGRQGLFRRWRKGPSRERDVHPSVRQRLEGRAEYRPGSLR
ncbi:DUF2235 domain-containing protein [Roseovarius sp. SCSIO 43702]|uniref:DUF2235 domain-containing protein n=1 Tax=Roseovarius sp. SCSIO 43702 TaxID=2823043 RepID=UPI001C73C5EF|nr:DUF2235 domain-containing protein [Roseovarius sp. SCSIO 43702]QYX56406.1 DUF2235 domain-containing protein [Roseovarius sp. SCSIO 43702]